MGYIHIFRTDSAVIYIAAYIEISPYNISPVQQCPAQAETCEIMGVFYKDLHPLRKACCQYLRWFRQRRRSRCQYRPLLCPQRAHPLLDTPDGWLQYCFLRLLFLGHDCQHTVLIELPGPTEYLHPLAWESDGVACSQSIVVTSITKSTIIFLSIHILH